MNEKTVFAITMIVLVSLIGFMFSIETENTIDICNIVKEQTCIQQDMTYHFYYGCYDLRTYSYVELNIECELVEYEYNKMINKQKINTIECNDLWNYSIINSLPCFNIAQNKKFSLSKIYLNTSLSPDELCEKLNGVFEGFNFINYEANQEIMNEIKPKCD